MLFEWRGVSLWVRHCATGRLGKPGGFLLYNRISIRVRERMRPLCLPSPHAGGFWPYLATEKKEKCMAIPNPSRPMSNDLLLGLWDLRFANEGLSIRLQAIGRANESVNFRHAHEKHENATGQVRISLRDKITFRLKRRGRRSHRMIRHYIVQLSCVGKKAMLMVNYRWENIADVDAHAPHRSVVERYF